MPPCYGYQIHDIDNELQLLCKYLWDPIQQNHLTKKVIKHSHQQLSSPQPSNSSISPNSSPKREIRTNNSTPNSNSTSVKSPSYSNSNISYNTNDDIKSDNNINITSMQRISHSYNKRKYNDINMPHHSHHKNNNTKKNISPKSPQTKTKKKPYFF